VINITLYPVRATCDIIAVGQSEENATPEQSELARNNLCGGEDFFLVPADDGVPFQLYIRYPKGMPVERGWEYDGDHLATNVFVPVLLEYHLFTLEADRIVYDSKLRTIEARGHVSVTDVTGKKQNTDSAFLRLANGRVAQIQ
jgi:hypothetical protein